MRKTDLGILGLCVVFVGGCTAITDFDRFGPTGSDGGPRDAAVPDDGGDCTEPTAELCNDRDDDCDGNVDENFNLDTDTQNCGGCANVCGAVTNGMPDCSGGECVPSCSPGFGDCDGAYATGCETDLSSPDECGECGVVCDIGTVCSASMGCVSDCPGTESICGRSCIDLSTSTVHCGACDNGCTAPARAVAVCMDGSCDFECEPGFDDCDGDPVNGCEADLSLIATCGACGNVCSFPNGVPACDGTACSLMACQSGFEDCDADTANGCEADLSSVDSCGGCSMACVAPAHASATCDGTACGFVCDGGFEDCDGDPANGCEADLSTDATCGACTTACSGSTPLCSGGTCVSGCMAPTPDRCGATCTSLATDPQNCGSCGTACPDPANATPTCAPGGSCGYTCDAGFEDCDGNPANGCERNVRTTSDCGGCGVACAPTNGTGSCSTGSCVISSCDTGFDDCNGVDSDGCEVNLATVMNCGSCGNACMVANGIPACTASTCVIAGCSAGYDDCNGMYADGCEEMPSTYYRDADMDGYGDATTAMAYCSASVPAGWVTNRDDCDDTIGTVNPVAMAVCDEPPVDNDCDGNTDEGFMVGSSCSCTPTSVPGVFGCDSASSSSCRYPTEACNGEDDDCDGVADNGFACAVGATRSCTTSCGSTGIQTCSSACGWGVCAAPTETCNFIDDDCDGDVDEGLLSRLSVQTWSATTPNEPMDIAYNPARNEIGVTYIDSAGDVYFARFPGDVSSMLGLYVLGGPTGSKRLPRIEATIDGDWFVSYFDAGVGRLYYTFLDSAHNPMGWSPFGSGDAGVYDVVAGTDTPRIWIIYRNGGATTLRSATIGSGLSGGIVAPNPFGSGLIDVAIRPFRTEFSVVYGSATSNAVEWRRIDSAGSTRAGPVPLLPTGNTYEQAGSLGSRSLFTDVIEGSSFATDRVGVFFHQDDSGGVNQFQLTLMDGNGSIDWAVGRNRGTLPGFMDLSPDEPMMAYLQFDDVRRHDLTTGTYRSVASSPTGYGVRGTFLAERVGNMRYYTFGRHASSSPNMELAGIGCVP